MADVFDGIDKSAEKLPRYKWLVEHASKPKKGSLDGFGYGIFHKWIDGKRTAKKLINGRALQVIETSIQEEVATRVK